MNYEVVATITTTKRVLVCDAEDEQEAKVIALDALQISEADLAVKQLDNAAEHGAAAKRANVASQISVFGDRVVVEKS